MSSALRILLAVSCLLLLASCLFEGEKGARKAIVPLAVGNVWSYVDSTYHRSDSITVDSSRTAITESLTVSLGGSDQTVYLSRSVSPVTGQAGSLATYLQDRSDGNHTVGAAQDGAVFLQEVLHVAWPARKGRRYPTWFLSFRSENGALVPVIDTLEIEIADARHVCTVPAGTFPCVQYRGWRGTFLHATAYYAPGVGYLGSEVVRTVEVNGTPREIVYAHRLKAFTLY
jgi:hypothetical protein